MIEFCYFPLDQWEIRIHLLWGKCFNSPQYCDPHLDQTKSNDLLPLTIHGVLSKEFRCISLYHIPSFIFQKKEARCNKSQVQLSICEIKCHFILSMAPCLCLCLMSVSSQGYGSNTQLLPPNITAYSQFVESTKSIFDQNPCFCCSCDSMLCVIIT